MPNHVRPAKAPALVTLLLEGRAIYELQALVWAQPWLQRTPRGDGHAVLVLPGFGAGDLSTLPLRQFLQSRGYNAHPWGLGINTGPILEFEHRAMVRLNELYDATGRKVSLIGWSLGGVYAREMGRVAPDRVRQVITLGSPLHNNPKANNAWRLYQVVSGQRLEEIGQEVIQQRRARLAIPLTSIYSRTDGVVAWECSLEPDGPLSENVEVISSHVGLGVNPTVLYVIADRLAQREDAWRPFAYSGWCSLLYRAGPAAPAPSRRG
ncbi:MAG TPA: alpha/beta hydrolase [Chloroflexia bacterium]|nr:alpha/beta hydrolase [Chloroflexia bacterium]